MRYQQVNYLNDVIMPTLANPNAFSVVSLIARNTWGKNGAEWVGLSFSDISEATGIKSINTIKKAIEAAGQFIEQCPKENQGYVYRMKTISNFDIAGTVSINDTVSDFDTELYQNLTPSISNNDIVSGEPKEKELKNNNNAREGSILSRLYRVFLEETGYDPPSDLPTREQKWDRPLLAIYKKAGGDIQKTQEAIQAGVKLLVKKKYTVSSPKSIQSAAVNWLGGVRERKPEDTAAVDAWREVKQAATNGHPPHFSNDRILEAVSSIWPEVKAMTDFNEREIRAKFERNYHAVT